MKNIPFEVIERFAKRNSISIADSVDIHNSLLQYLDESFISKKPISPTLLQDEAWHAFILHTILYSDFCKNRYGRYMHHVPEGMTTDSFATKVKSLLAEQNNVVLSRCNEGECKHTCGSDCNPPSGERLVDLPKIDFFTK